MKYVMYNTETVEVVDDLDVVLSNLIEGMTLYGSAETDFDVETLVFECEAL
ncbi:hypothetical protein [Alicyclobacillus sp. SO9]|uniref:hypothetical protein n=1 Tax=Alicyclobacillus sp. SO9 TaxID=2665646 RepID=UPI0018E7A019|nr:hypothetical protein [Alicyclobacillus sp. SO9]QQE77438.1 hypothetical protein GI364_15975 [Alicyclobacillus sp. SO9]